MLHKQDILALQEKILSWYAVHKRELPWRDTFDPYKVLVSETMLQQTQVERVIPKFLLWMETLPRIEDLAEVDKPTLLRLWSGLGFNSRAVRLQQAARILVADVSSQTDMFPRTREEWLALPGVGPYTSAAVLAFAYDIEVPVVDTNIRRVLIWELGLEEHIGLKELEEIALACVPEGRSNDRHNALMDYGSAVATAKITGIKPLSKQSKFAGSARQTRGRILKYLLDHEQATIEQLQKLFPHEKFDSIIVGMVKDEILGIEGEILKIM